MRVFKYGMTDSTNTRAREYAKSEGGELPAVFIADGQTEGRGRRGRSFDSELGAGLYISFLFLPKGRGATPADITVRAAVALIRSLKKAFGLSAEIKWINDIFVGGRKLAGILAEGEFNDAGELSYAVLGIGVNLKDRKFPEEISDIATSVEAHVGGEPDREGFAKILTEQFFSVLAEQSVIEEYKSYSCVIGKQVLVRRMSGESFSAKVLDITPGGELLVLREDGERELLFSAEISIRV